MPDEDKLDFTIFLKEFLDDSREGIQEINDALLVLEKDPSQRALLDEIFRAFHTLKSSSRMLEFTDISDYAHDCEDFIDRMRKGDLLISRESVSLLFEGADIVEGMVKVRAEGNRIDEDLERKIGEFKLRTQEVKQKSGAGEVREERHAAAVPAIEKIKTVRVDVNLLDALFNAVGELTITRNRVKNLLSGLMTKEMKEVFLNLDHTVAELQDKISAARMVAVDEVFRRFPRMVRDLSVERKKKIEFIIEGSETEIDKGVLDSIGEPVIHLLRNAVGHGIERTDVREKAGKKMAGTVRLAAKRAESNIIVEVEDDGAGIDTETVRTVAVRKGFLGAEEAGIMPEKDLQMLLFRPGFTTLEEVTSLSGRGVGLDVVKTVAERLGGAVEISAKKGKGTRVTLRLPLAPSVMQTLMIMVGGQAFIIPSDMVLETMEAKPADIRDMGDGKVLVLHNEVIPFIPLKKVLNLNSPAPYPSPAIPYPLTGGGRGEVETIFAVIIHRGGRFLALGVDAVLDQTENIIKTFDPIASGLKGVTGGAILADGSVALLLNMATLFEGVRAGKGPPSP